MKKIWLSLFFTLLSLLIPKLALAAAPQITGPITVTPANAQVTTYQKIEWSFDLSKTYPNPYYYYDATDTPATNPSRMTWVGADGITVNAIITLPNQSTVTVPAFYFQDYSRDIPGSGVTILGKKNQPHWVVRYAASIVGSYSIYFTAQDADGTTQTSSQNFNVTAGTNPGFVRVNQSDPRYMIFDNGSSFVPNARGNAQGDNYESRFMEFQQYGINLIRIWDQMDYGLGVEGANTVWQADPPVYNRAVGITFSETHSGLRAAQPSTGWRQSLVVSEPNRTHKLRLWTKGQITYQLLSVDVIPGDPIPNTTFTVTGTDYVLHEISLIPNTSKLAIHFYGSGYVDDVSFGPTDAQGNLLYDIVTDGGMERHFGKGLDGNDPDTDPTLPRPLGNFINQDEAWLQDQYVAVAEQTGVKIQLCSCSGPWFTWPGNPENPDPWTWSDPWVLKSWQRNFRYRVARWGYSTAILAWENHNEHGHILPTDAEYSFYQNYGTYQTQTDPYHHLRTTSQGSQAFSSNFWSSNAFDLVNYHDYMMSNRYNANLTNDEVNFVHRFAWCLTGKETNTLPDANDADCYELGIGDSTQWIIGHIKKPFVWGEIGVGTTVWNEPNSKGTTGEGAHRVHHNTTWTGLFSPMGTVPINWYDDIDNTTTNQLIYNERKIAADFFSTINFSTSNFVHLMTDIDIPTGYNGENISVTNDNNKARVFALRSADKYRLYAWVQHRDHTWYNSPSVPSAINPTITFGGLLPVPYTISQYNTYTGTTTPLQTTTPTDGNLSVSLSNLTTDTALIITTPSAPTPTPSATPIAGDLNTSGHVDFLDIWHFLTNFNQYDLFTFNTIVNHYGQ